METMSLSRYTESHHRDGRDREQEAERERQRDRETERQRDRETEREIERERERDREETHCVLFSYKFDAKKKQTVENALYEC
jgi:CRISPR/Cas system-associated protein Cas5 (RAMP superfamily)